MKPNEKDDRFRVLIADENLDYKPHIFDDPKVLGRQIIEAGYQALRLRDSYRWERPGSNESAGQ